MQNLKHLSVGLALLAGTMSVPAHAELTGNIGVASQYIFRGVSFGDPQVSGGIDWSGPGGFYAGTWISSAGDEQEVDFYGGWANDLLDVGYIYYYFPDDIGTQDAAEVYAGISVGMFSAMAWYAPSGFSNIDDDEYVYVEANLDLPLTEKISLGIHAGVTEGLGDAYDGTDSTLVDYSLTLGFGDLFLMVSATDYDVAVVTTQEKNKPTFTIGYGWTFDNL